MSSWPRATADTGGSARPPAARTGPVCGSVTKPSPASRRDRSRPHCRSRDSCPSPGRGRRPPGRQPVAIAPASIRSSVAGSPASSVSIATRGPGRPPGHRPTPRAPAGGDRRRTRSTGCRRRRRRRQPSPAGPAGRARVAEQAVLRERDDGDVDDPTNSSRSRDHRLEPTSPAAVSTSANACTCSTPLRTPSASACRSAGSIARPRSAA